MTKFEIPSPNMPALEAKLKDIAKMNRWTYCIDMTELLQRSSSTGGYLGFCKDVFTY